MAVKLAVIGLYVIILVFIALYSSRKISNVGDFFIADRGVGPWVSAFAYGTTYFSAVMFVGYAGKLGSGFGLNIMYIVAGNVIIGSLLAWLILARRTRQMTAHLDAITMPEFLASRYGASFMRPLSAIVIFIFLIPYSASVYIGLGHLFEVNLGIPYLWAEIFIAAITGGYLLVGGYLAITLTDFFQGIVQLFGVTAMVILLVKPFKGLIGAIGVASVPSNAPALHAAWPGDKFASAADAVASGAFPGWVILLSLVIITSLGVFGLPQMVQKFYSIKSTRDIRPAMIVSTAFSLIIAGGAYFCGALARPSFELMGVAAPSDPDMIIPLLLSHGTPEWFSVLILLVVLAASMSTLASLVLVGSASVSVDMLGLRTRGKDADAKGVLVLRMLCGLFIALSVVMAAVKVTFIVNLMVISWGALAGTFMAPYVYGLFWRRANSQGATAAMIVGLCTAVGLFIRWGAGGVPVAGAIAMLLPLLVMPVVSLLTKAPDAEHVEYCFAGNDLDESESSGSPSVEMGAE